MIIKTRKGKGHNHTQEQKMKQILGESLKFGERVRARLRWKVVALTKTRCWLVDNRPRDSSHRINVLAWWACAWQHAPCFAWWSTTTCEMEDEHVVFLFFFLGYLFARNTYFGSVWNVILSLSLSLSHTHTHTIPHLHTPTHKHTFFVALSLALF